MTHSPRYAIYYAAAPGSALDRFGAQHLGYDAWTGEGLPFPDAVTREAPDWRDLSEGPRKYGFHATLKAPMPLAPGRTEAELLAA
ncbi:MAG: phosphonate metabolism protein, partial [Bradyrhizobium sp.]